MRNFNDKLGYILLDRHDIEISYLNNIIDSQKLNGNQIEELSHLYINSDEKPGIDANLIDKYLWNIGNEFCNKKMYQLSIMKRFNKMFLNLMNTTF